MRLVVRIADTGLLLATSRSFELAIGEFSSYLQAHDIYLIGRGRLVNGTAHAASQNEAAQRRVGHYASAVLLRISALVILVAVLFLGAFTSEARAHGFHSGMTVQMPANWAESTVSQDESEAMSAQTGCGVNCCSATGCAAAVLNAVHPTIVIVAIDNRYALSRHTSFRPSPRSTLKRPPKA